MESKLLSSIFNNEDIKFYYKNKYINLGEYEELNIKVIDHIINEENKLNTMVYIGDESMYIIFLIKIAVESYLKNITNKDNYILDNINIGDKVSVDGKIGQYIGVENVKGYGEGVKISFKKGDKSTILKKSLYKVLPYNGDCDISHMTNNVSTKSTISKEVISYLLNKINSKEIIEDFTGVIKQTNVVVIPNKQYIDDIVKEITIEFKGKEVLFTEVFPCTYITSGQNIIHLPGNYSKQEPLINFTSSISVAYEFIRYNKNIENVFILGGKHIEREFIDLENIISRKSVKQINIISDMSQILNISNIIINKSISNNENKIFAWTKNALLNLSLSEYIDEDIEVFSNQQNIVDKYIYRTYGAEIVSNYKKSDVIQETRRLMSILLKTELNDKYKTIFIINVYGLLNIIETTPFTMNILEKSIEKLGIKITLPRTSLENLRRLKKEIIIDDSTEKIIDEIVNNIEVLINYMDFKNYKLEKLIGKLSKYRTGKYSYKNNKKTNVLVVVKKQYEAIILKKYLEEQNIRVDVVSIDNFNVNKIYDNVFILGLYKSNKIDLFNDMYLFNSKYILYKSEEIRYKYIENKNIYLNKLLEKNNKIYDILEFNSYDIIDNTIENHGDLNKEQEIVYINEIDEYIENNKFEIDFTKISYYQNIDIKTMINVEKIIISEKNEYALLTKNYKAQYIDWDNYKIIKKDITEIKEGDSLLFINEYLDEESNVVINVIERMISENKFNDFSKSDISIKEKYELTKYWKSKLELYRKKNNLTYKELADSMKIYGANVHHVTIANWINNIRIIGPRDKSIYVAISMLIDDTYMQNNVDKFYEASKDIRKLHTKVKGYIDKLIIRKFCKQKLNKEDNISRVILEELGDTNQYVTTIQVESISDYNKEIPQYLSNKLLDMENTY